MYCCGPVGCRFREDFVTRSTRQSFYSFGYLHITTGTYPTTYLLDLNAKVVTMDTCKPIKWERLRMKLLPITESAWQTLQQWKCNYHEYNVTIPQNSLIHTFPCICLCIRCCHMTSFRDGKTHNQTDYVFTDKRGDSSSKFR